MKASQLLDNFGDIVLDRITLNLGTGGEITLTDSDPQLPHGAVVAFRAEARVGAFKVEAEKHIGRVILTIDASSFVIDTVEMPVEEPATEPMIGPDGEIVVAADVTDAIVADIAPTAHPFVADPDSPAFCTRCNLPESEHKVPEDAERKKRKAKADALPTESNEVP